MIILPSPERLNSSEYQNKKTDKAPSRVAHKNTTKGNPLTKGDIGNNISKSQTTSGNDKP